MSLEFYVESHISSKQLNHQSVSLIIPRLTRDKIHNNIYYKVNLSIPSLRGDTLAYLMSIIIRDFGTLEDVSINQTNMLGGIVFKCILMKLVEIKPTIEQLRFLFEKDNDIGTKFSSKYIVSLLLTYIRTQYYYLNINDDQAIYFRSIFRKYMSNYRKLKSIDMHLDCMTMSQNLPVSIIHLDELVDWLVTKDEIWGIPLGRCTWCNIFDDDSDDSDSSSDSSSTSSS